MTRELLIGTRKGLFTLRGDGGGPYEVAGRTFEGNVVEYAMRDSRSGRYFASVTSGFYGPRLWHSMDPTAPLEDWTHAETLAMPEDTQASLERIWVVRTGEADDQLWAGVDPAALFESRDGGLTWIAQPAACGTSRAGTSGSPAAAGSACTRSSRGPGSR